MPARLRAAETSIKPPRPCADGTIARSPSAACGPASTRCVALYWRAALYAVRSVRRPINGSQSIPKTRAPPDEGRISSCSTQPPFLQIFFDLRRNDDDCHQPLRRCLIAASQNSRHTGVQPPALGLFPHAIESGYDHGLAWPQQHLLHCAIRSEEHTSELQSLMR